VADAKKFLRLGYLWGGTSVFGYDCSGFSYSVYHAEGVVIRGTPVRSRPPGGL
jgi:cell wall-associated NlpC family hydrolase